MSSIVSNETFHLRIINMKQLCVLIGEGNLNKSKEDKEDLVEKGKKGIPIEETLKKFNFPIEPEPETPQPKKSQKKKDKIDE